MIATGSRIKSMISTVHHRFLGQSHLETQLRIRPKQRLFKGKVIRVCGMLKERCLSNKIPMQDKLQTHNMRRCTSLALKILRVSPLQLEMYNRLYNRHRSTKYRNCIQAHCSHMPVTWLCILTRMVSGGAALSKAPNSAGLRLEAPKKSTQTGRLVALRSLSM